MSYSAPETPSAQRPERPTARPSERVQIFALPTRTMYGSLRFSWLSYLGLAEQQHAAQLPTSTAAVSYLSTQALMRAMAAARLDVPSSAASEIEVDRSCTLCTSGKKHGKPRIAGVNFNMSQVNPLVVGAFSRNSSAVLGVDVETLDARLFSGFARLALSNEERTFYERVAQERPAPVLHLLSVALWTAKEAVLKATGHGLSVVPSLVRVQLTDELLDALELAMNEEVPGDLLDSNIPEPTALRILAQDRLAVRATFSAPLGSGQNGNQGGEAIERSFSLQWVPVALPDAENPEHAQKMLIALAVENPAGGEPEGEYGGEPAQVEAQLLPVATPLELKRLLTD
ncbi:4'-phosphopantetheinyl transferase superfamily protein [Rothia mucilaginosa]|uniref:4'-phosphopantetheinyl transferase family protein n=1 Tax=Rothia mucilaginosa TaxID=43675 RepID=UPI00288B4D48|nr:4'-phosphopantetheinyl transferase superfamily protein [Rothia mucilaginosa]